MNIKTLQDKHKIFAIALVLSLTLAGLFYFKMSEHAAALSNDMTYSVVKINVYEEVEGTLLWVQVGSGSIISQDGLILTNNHVISDAEGTPYEIIEICYLQSPYEPPFCSELAAVVVFNTDFDLALLKPVARLTEGGATLEEIPADDTGYFPVTFSTTNYDNASLPQIRDQLSTVGYPSASLTGNISTTAGQVTGYGTGYDEVSSQTIVITIETDALVNPGNSGGAAFDKNNRFVGVPSLVSTGGVSGQYGYILAVTIVNAWLDTLVEDGTLSFNPNQYVYGKEQIELDGALSKGVDLPGQADLPTDAGNLSQNAKLFLDVGNSHPNYDAIFYLKENKIVGGYPDGTFKPDSQISRAELMKIIALASGEKMENYQNNNCFPDVKDEWFAQYVCFAKTRGWVQGYPDGMFKPAQNVKKVEALKMLLNAKGFAVASSVVVNSFSDVPKTQWYAPYVQKAKEIGILEETGAQYFPGNNALRGGIAENIYRVLTNNNQ